MDRPYHFILNNAPVCRPRSGTHWALTGVRTAVEFEACDNRCKACEKSKRWAFIQRKAS